MKISNSGIELIKLFEGYRDKAYCDPVGVWTIGWGTTRINGKKLTPGMTCTKEQATKYLISDCRQFEKIVNSVKVPLTQNMYDALVSFCYNLGSLGKNMKVYLNAQQYKKAADEFDLFVHMGGKVVSGLVDRRKKEKELFLKDMYIQPKGLVTNKTAKVLEGMWIQTKLGITADGIWGKDTAAAIKAKREKLGWKPGNGLICTKNLIKAL